MFDTVAGILENGPYCPKDASRNSWEGRMRDYFDDTDNCRKTSVSQTLNRPEARILIYGDGGGSAECGHRRGAGREPTHRAAVAEAGARTGHRGGLGDRSRSRAQSALG